MIRFYDKYYNLLWSGEEMPRVLVLDRGGDRQSFFIEVHGTPVDPELLAQRVPDEPR